VEVVGVILNKVETEKIPLVAEYAGKGLARFGVPLLGIIPKQNLLTSPNLTQVAEEIGGQWLNAPASRSVNRIKNVIIGAGTAKGIIDDMEPGTLVITPGDREDIILAALLSGRIAGRRAIAGLVLTNDIAPHSTLLDLLRQTEIPVILANEECFTITSKIQGMTVKTLPEDTDKFPVIKQMVLDHVDLERLLASV